MSIDRDKYVLHAYVALQSISSSIGIMALKVCERDVFWNKATDDFSACAREVLLPSLLSFYISCTAVAALSTSLRKWRRLKQSLETYGVLDGLRLIVLFCMLAITLGVLFGEFARLKDEDVFFLGCLMLNILVTGMVHQVEVGCERTLRTQLRRCKLSISTTLCDCRLSVHRKNLLL